jgi:hypothetical protein
MILSQGSGNQSGNTLISLTSSNELLATLVGVQANTLSSSNFVLA